MFPLFGDESSHERQPFVFKLKFTNLQRPHQLTMQGNLTRFRRSSKTIWNLHENEDHLMDHLYIELMVGDDNKVYHMIVDTDSDLTWLKCTYLGRNGLEVNYLIDNN